MDAIGQDNVFPADPGHGAAMDKALEAAQKWLAGRQAASVGDKATGEDAIKAETE